MSRTAIQAVSRLAGLFWMTAAALALLLAALVTTLAVNVPINLAEGAWNVQSPPPDWASMRDRWQMGHLIRTCAALLALGALAIAAAGLRSRSDRDRGAASAALRRISLQDPGSRSG